MRKRKGAARLLAVYCVFFLELLARNVSGIHVARRHSVWSKKKPSVGGVGRA